MGYRVTLTAAKEYTGSSHGGRWEHYDRRELPMTLKDILSDRASACLDKKMAARLVGPSWAELSPRHRPQ